MKIIDLDKGSACILGFGKYRDKPIEEVRRIDPGYLIWVYWNTTMLPVRAKHYMRENMQEELKLTNKHRNHER